MSTSDTIPAGWKTARELGIATWQAEYLRRAGKLAEEKDYIRVRADTWPVTRPKIYYRPAAVKQALRGVAAPQSEKLGTWWEARQRVVDADGNELVLLKTAIAVLGVSERTLSRWTDEGCEYLDGGRLYTETRPGPGKLELRYWSRPELEEVKRRRLRTPRRPAGPGVYTPEQTAELTGVSTDLLRRKEERERLGLVAVRRPALVGSGSRRGAARNTTRAAARLAFTRASVDAYVAANPRPSIPPGWVTTAAAAAELGTDRTTVRKWAKAGLLRYRRAKVPGVKQPCWLIDRAGVERVRDAIIAIGGAVRRGPNGMREALQKLAGSPVVPAAQEPRQAPPGPPTNPPEFGGGGETNGPAEPCLFRFKGREVDLSGAPLRYRLLCSLWDVRAGRPLPSRSIGDVISDVYDEHDQDDEHVERRLNNLQFTTNQIIRGRLGLNIASGGGRFWLAEKPQKTV